MFEIVDKIKAKLFKKEIKEKTELDMIEKLLMLTDVNLYTDECYETEIFVLYESIDLYIQWLKANRPDQLSKMQIHVNDVHESSFKSIKIAYWYTINGRGIIEGESLFKEWLELTKDYIKWHSESKVNSDNIIVINNIRRREPYYNNLINLVEALYKILIK